MLHFSVLNGLVLHIQWLFRLGRVYQPVFRYHVLASVDGSQELGSPLDTVGYHVSYAPAVVESVYQHTPDLADHVIVRLFIGREQTRQHHDACRVGSLYPALLRLSVGLLPLFRRSRVELRLLLLELFALLVLSCRLFSIFWLDLLLL